MHIPVLYSKIHRATVTKCELEYNGSIGIDADILKQANLIEGQQVDVLNINNGSRFTTYVIPEASGSKTFGIYGAAARLAQKGDKIIIIAYAHMEPQEAQDFNPHILLME